MTEILKFWILIYIYLDMKFSLWYTWKISQRGWVFIDKWNFMKRLKKVNFLPSELRIKKSRFTCSCLQAAQHNQLYVSRLSCKTMIEVSWSGNDDDVTSSFTFLARSWHFSPSLPVSNNKINIIHVAYTLVKLVIVVLKQQSSSWLKIY